MMKHDLSQLRGGVRPAKAKREALKVGMSCKVKGAMRKGKYEAKTVSCK